jgi:hypothetical protein
MAIYPHVRWHWFARVTKAADCPASLDLGTPPPFERVIETDHDRAGRGKGVDQQPQHATRDPAT